MTNVPDVDQTTRPSPNRRIKRWAGRLHPLGLSGHPLPKGKCGPVEQRPYPGIGEPTFYLVNPVHPPNYEHDRSVFVNQ